MDLELKDKVALITGGSAGIGLAVAQGLAREQVNVVICARDQARAIKQAEQIEQTYSVKALGLHCDVTQPGDIESIVSALDHNFGGADILINNAGEGSNETIMTAPDDRWQYYWDLHVMAAVRFSRGVVPGMQRRGGGVIINNGSICAKQPIGYEPIYNVTKAALMMLSKCLADELIGDGIRVNCINPGLIMTSSWENWAKKEAATTSNDWHDYLDKIAGGYAPIGRFATTDELADFFVFLCSPRASYCVGSTYYIDGGWLKTV